MVGLWAAGRIAALSSALIGPAAAGVLDLAFPAVFLAVIAREIAAGKNWRNLPMVVALALLLVGNLLVHLRATGIAATAAFGNRLGIATALLLISLIGGRILPSFTHNWLAKQRPGVPAPAGFGRLDRAALAVTAIALLVWVLTPTSPIGAVVEIAAGCLLALRLARWRGVTTWREPPLWALHLGYGWLAVGFVLLGISGLRPVLPQTAAVHALTVGAVGTMTLAVMTRASLGHTGRPLTAGPGATAIYVVVTFAAVLRVAAPLGGGHYLLLLQLAGTAWSAAFTLFVALYGRPLWLPRAAGGAARPI